MVITLVILLLQIVSCHTQDDPIVETIYGRIRGRIDTTEAGQSYEIYQGVPFGAPPLGELRFAKSIPPEPWEGILDTTEFATGCIEISNTTDTSEDCLYLNLYIPGLNRSGENLAVMVFLHGGAYFLGTPTFYPGQDLAIHGDVIVVTTSYRLGALGFLSTEDEASPGNYGLWDVKLALEWVRDNIAAFGGSPDRVTVFGQSAGGSLTSHVMISPETQGLLARGICISGATAGYIGVAQPGGVADSTELLGRTFGCPVLNDSFALVSCLREMNPHEINYWGALSVILFKQQQPNFVPVIDGQFIPVHPAIAWNQTAPSDLDLITGAVINDAAFAVLSQPPNNPNVTINMAETLERTEAFLGYVFSPYKGDEEEIKQALIDQYPDIAVNDTVPRTQAVSELYTDFFFHTGQHYEALHHSMVSGATYMYQYAYPNSFLQGIKPVDHPWVVADHSDDLFMVFGEEFLKDWREYVLQEEFSEEDKNMSSVIMSYYTNFAKTGNPNEGSEVPVYWPQYTQDAKEFLEFSEDTQVKTEPEDQLDHYRFWIEDFPDLVKLETIDEF